MEKRGIISVKKIIISIIILVIMLMGILVLSRPAAGIVDIKSELPAIGSSPIYVEMKDGEGLSRRLLATSNKHINALKLLLVNTEGEKGAALLVKVSHINEGSDEELLFEEAYGLDEFQVGEWTTIPCDIFFEAGESYLFSFCPSGGNPYFMQVAGYDLDISLGFDVVSNKQLTYGDIFYYSQAIILLIGVLAIGLILLGQDRIIKVVKELKLGEMVTKYGCEVFMLLLFVTLLLEIYSTAYVNGIYITADSDGYLREAVNLVAGNGFAYDGLAGYKSWFANWPIIYPAMIALVMLLTGTNAYLASKLVAIICFGVIEIILYVAFKKDAWIYALTLTNLGVLGMAYNTWSEIPFMVFMLIFGIALGKIVSEKEVKPASFILLTIAGTATYLTRYFGIFVWFVAGIYFLLLLGKKEIKKSIGLMISAAISGVIYISYLMMNKLMNGNPTGVSRGTWWDDYKSLTDDLIGSLVTEIFNIFSLEVPKVIDDMPRYLQVWFILLISVFVAIIIHKCLAGCGGLFDRYMSSECVFIMMALVYYGMFIVIRYRSSMDTFYFRFFAPASFLLCIGLIGLCMKDIKKSRALPYVTVFICVMTLASFINVCGKTDWSGENNYYDIATGEWDEEYKDIPFGSVVIWSDLDYRSTWYRPDVYSGELFADDNLDTLSERYYGSGYMCIRKDYAKTIIDEGDYDKELKSKLKLALDVLDDETTYVSLALR